MERIKLEDLRPAEGATGKIKRVGRGRSSGMGKTSCRGNNGEGQRAGRSSKRGFEGGQMPGYRQMPKLKGFKNFNAICYAEINVSSIGSKTKIIIYFISNVYFSFLYSITTFWYKQSGICKYCSW